MDRFSGHPSPTEGLEPLGRRLSYGVVLAFVLTMVLVGTGGLGGASTALPGTPSGHGSAPASPFAPAVQPATTHGDLVVASGQTVTIEPTLGGHTYFQGGNVTVLAGGTLIVRNVTLSFVQFVANVGTAQSRLSHIVHFLDQGTVDLYNSTVTTDAALLNAYVKLNVTVTGTFTAWDSTLAFPGWVTATGATADLTLNSSAVTSNPAIAGLNELPSILGDTLYAPSIAANGGAHLNLFNSSLNDTYADNTAAYGIPSPAPLNATGVALPSNVTALSTPSDSANLTRDYLYPGGIAYGNVGVWYNSSLSTPSVFTVKVWFGGVGYSLGGITLANNTLLGYATANFTPALTHAIDTAGMLTYLNYTGAFGAPLNIAIQFQLTSGSALPASQVRLVLLPELQYNYVVDGVGTVVNSVDSSLNLSWNPVPLSPWDQKGALPWLSNKLLVTGGASAYLGNLSVPNLIPGVFSTSAVLPDASSTAYLYRWASLNLTGRGGTIPIYGAAVSAYYAYPNTQLNNATANGLNNLASTSPAIWGYVQYKDAHAGLPGYGMSGRSGVAAVLLASSMLNGTTTPDGVFLGAYHVGVILPIPTNNSRWFNWSVSPYPVGVALGTPGYGGPDNGPNQHFPQYFAGATLGSPVVTTNGTATAGGPRIGQVITFNTTATSVGPAPITSAVAVLIYDNNQTLATTGIKSVPLTSFHATYSFELSWLINDSVVKLQERAVNATFTVTFVWNPGNVSGISGIVNASVVESVHPSQVSVVATSFPPTTLDLQGLYITPGVLQYNGSEAASLLMVATPVGSTQQIVIGTGEALPGPFTLSWYPLQQLLSAGTTYTLSVEATYNGVTAVYNLPGTYSVPGGTSSSNFLNYSFLGLTIWPYWILIVSAVVVALVAFLLVSRRQAAGKLVECGECGNLIPEDATICPKCGAEFEANLIRCSRCSSTIPSNSKVCPECAALLLGTADEAGESAERQGYQDFTEKYRAEAKKELGENYNEGSFWDWWKRQPTYVPYNQWKLQQGQGTPRTGMSEPPAPGGPSGGNPPAAAPAPVARAPPKVGTAPPPATGAAAKPAAPAAAAAAPAQAAPGFKICPGCGKEIPGDYLICPFCSSVVQ